MYGHDSLFLYFARRAQQEQVAAINASNPAAAVAHRELSRLHAREAAASLPADWPARAAPLEAFA